MARKELGHGFVNVDDRLILHYEDEVYSKFYKEIDIPTFEIIQSNGSSFHYFRDKNHVYLESYMNRFCRLEDADPLDFQLVDFENGFASSGPYDYVFDQKLPYRFKEIQELGGMYQQVDTEIYFTYTEKLEQADPATFEVLQGDTVGNVAKDQNHVYFRSEIVPEADAQSFLFLEQCFTEAYYRECDHTFYAVDKTQAYYVDTVSKKMKRISTKNVHQFRFEVRDGLGYAFDENYTYLFGKRQA